MRRYPISILITLAAFILGCSATAISYCKIDFRNLTVEDPLTTETNLANERVRKVESLNRGFDELLSAADGSVVTVEGLIDQKFLCPDVTDLQPGVCSTVLTGSSDEHKSLLIRLKTCGDAAVRSNCIVWKPGNLCSAGHLCSNRIGIYDHRAQLVELVSQLGENSFMTKSVKLKAAGKVSIVDGKARVSTPLEKIEIIELPPALSENLEPAAGLTGKKEEFRCEDAVIKTIWDQLAKDQKFIGDALSVLEARRINDCEKVFEKQVVELNDDQAEEFIVRGTRPLFCGSGGDCRTWLLAKSKKGYRVLLDIHAAEDDGGFLVLPGRTSKFSDLKIKKNHHWAADNFGYFKFDGKQYRVRKCFEDVNSAYDYDNVRDEKLISVKLSDCA